MKAGKYSVRELFVNNYIDQIIIPEIQRDYVWGEEQTVGLLESILEDYLGYQKVIVPVQSNDTEVKALFENFFKKQKYASNIGFLYAYNDPEYVGKYFLIDGQQRITTIYLIVLALCVKIDKSVFEKYYFTNNILKVDYKVRDSAHLFMNDFVKHILSGGNYSVENIKQQYWYFSSNDLDLTIQSIIRNYSHIFQFLDENNLFTGDFLNYAQNFIEFWYFDTNLSDQGEELYIYMNARGEQIQTNENLKADLLGKLKIEDLELVLNRNDYSETNDINGLKNYWGKKWETWQDFFWQRKGKINENADIGFNEFINCIAGLEYYKRRLINDAYRNSKPNELISLIDIERNITALEYLESEQESFCCQYNYAEWVGKYYSLVWSYINKYTKRNANWFANFKDKNKNDDRNNMILLWSLFYYFEVKRESIHSDEFFRVMRFFFLRFHNYNRSVPTLKKTIDLIAVNGIIDSIENELGIQDDIPDEETDAKFHTAEEKEKYTFLLGLISEPDSLRKYESLIWKIEDHEYNLDGSYLKNINITHLVDFAANPTLLELQKICERFYLLMEFGEGFEEEELINLLLHYGEFWNRVSPWYYYNFEFNNWRRIIRGADGDKQAFKNFFRDFITHHEPIQLNRLLDNKNKAFLSETVSDIFAISDFGKQLIVYSIILDDIWSEGFHICYENEDPETRFFEQELSIFNCQRYKGAQWYLWDAAKEKYNDRITIEAFLNEKLKNTKKSIPHER